MGTIFTILGTRPAESQRILYSQLKKLYTKVQVKN